MRSANQIKRSFKVAKSFEVWVKQDMQSVCLNDESDYMLHLNELMRSADLVNEQFVVTFHLKNVIGGIISRASAVCELW